MAAFDSSSVTILGVGNPLLDISTVVPESVLDKYGVKVRGEKKPRRVARSRSVVIKTLLRVSAFPPRAQPGDIILAEEQHLPVYKELEDNYKVDYIAGGATQNSIRVAAWMMQSKTSCAYMGCVGDDEYGRTLKKCCDEGGVNAHYMVDKATPTGTCACLIKDSERTLITNLGAANNYNKEHLESEESLKLVNAAKVIYSAGFFLTSGGPPCTTFLGQKCSDEGKLYCLNLSAPFICQFFTAQLDETMPFVDIVFANETEAAALGEVKGWGTDVSEIALKLAAQPKASGTHARMVVFTQGASSTVVVLDGKVRSARGAARRRRGCARSRANEILRLR